MAPSVLDTIHALQGPCACGLTHETSIRDVRIGPGLVHRVGEILAEDGFPRDLLLVADRHTLAAAQGILESLTGFRTATYVYDELRVATMERVEELKTLLAPTGQAVLSVGTGSVNDVCRMAAAHLDRPLCIFATAPSMDGFASYSAPIVANGFKASYPAKSPEVILGDTQILAAAPAALKSAGFGDMVAKYVALVDWRVSALLTGERWCDKVAGLTREAVDRLMAMADRITARDQEAAGEIFAALLLTGIGMSFMRNSRPASGSEHIISHLIECKELPLGIVPNYHGEDIGVCTLEMLRLYRDLAARPRIRARRETPDWDAIYRYYGPMAEDVRQLNTPDTVTDAVDPADLEAKWPQIREIVASVPSYETCEAAMRRAGCKLTYQDIGKSRQLMDDCIRYSPYMRRRLTLLRLLPMIEL